MSVGDIYNPLAKLNLGKSVAEALLDGPAYPLYDLPRFSGAGIYVIYYQGAFKPYAHMAEANGHDLRWPIYIGKAVPRGGRRGAELFTTETGEPLFKRMREHAKSILEVEQADGNLRLQDFQARFLIVDDVWIPLGESLLISRFRPVWNGYLDGFGNHQPGSGRISGLRPLWDTFHPGRRWAGDYPERPETPREITAEVERYLREHQPPESPHMRFMPTST
jgi:hypothetical protein